MEEVLPNPVGDEPVEKYIEGHPACVTEGDEPEELAEEEREKDEATRRVIPNREERRRYGMGFDRKWWQRHSPRPAPISITAHLPRRDVYVRALVRKMKRENNAEAD